MAHLERPDNTLLTALEVALNYRGCKPCPAGFYCPTTGLTAPLTCGKGFFSNAVAILCTVCPFNTYCDSITTSFALQNPCPNGYICPIGLGVKPYIPDYACPKGYYC